MLREEVGRSGDVSVGVADLPLLKRAINKAYATLYDDYDWAFLRRVFPRVALSAGQRYYDLPTGLNVDRVETVHVWYNALPSLLPRGIRPEHYATYDPEADTRSDPALAWDVRDVAGATQIEIWPLPSSDNQELQFVGIRAAPKLVYNADTCLLDDELVVLLAAEQILRRQKSADADSVLAQFRARLQRLKGRASAAGNQRVRIGLGDSEDPIGTRTRITISG